MNKLSLDDIVRYQNAKLAVSKLEQPIIDRVEYIVRTIHEVFDCYYDYWYFEGAQEGEVGPIPDLTFASMSDIYIVGSSLAGKVKSSIRKRERAFIEKGKTISFC